MSVISLQQLQTSVDNAQLPQTVDFTGGAVTRNGTDISWAVIKSVMTDGHHITPGNKVSSKLTTTNQLLK